jgi:hypothetical protein
MIELGAERLQRRPIRFTLILPAKKRIPAGWLEEGKHRSADFSSAMCVSPIGYDLRN